MFKIQIHSTLYRVIDVINLLITITIFSVVNEEQLKFPSVSICAQPFINSTAIKKLNLNQNIWNFFKYGESQSFENWPIKNSTLDYRLWEQTTYGFFDIIKNVSLSNYFLNADFQFEDNNSWLFIKVMKNIL